MNHNNSIRGAAITLGVTAETLALFIPRMKAHEAKEKSEEVKYLEKQLDVAVSNCNALLKYTNRLESHIGGQP
jgi:hypothetical protein